MFVLNILSETLNPWFAAQGKRHEHPGIFVWQSRSCAWSDLKWHKLPGAHLWAPEITSFFYQLGVFKTRKNNLTNLQGIQGTNCGKLLHRTWFIFPNNFLWFPNIHFATPFSGEHVSMATSVTYQCQVYFSRAISSASRVWENGQQNYCYLSPTLRILLWYHDQW